MKKVHLTRGQRYTISAMHRQGLGLNFNFYPSFQALNFCLIHFYFFKGIGET
jgi:hypothetical protein